MRFLLDRRLYFAIFLPIAMLLVITAISGASTKNRPISLEFEYGVLRLSRSANFSVPLYRLKLKLNSNWQRLVGTSGQYVLESRFEKVTVPSTIDKDIKLNYWTKKISKDFVIYSTPVVIGKHLGNVYIKLPLNSALAESVEESSLELVSIFSIYKGIPPQSILAISKMQGNNFYDFTRLKFKRVPGNSAITSIFRDSGNHVVLCDFSGSHVLLPLRGELDGSECLALASKGGYWSGFPGYRVEALPIGISNTHIVYSVGTGIDRGIEFLNLKSREKELSFTTFVGGYEITSKTSFWYFRFLKSISKLTNMDAFSKAFNNYCHEQKARYSPEDISTIRVYERVKVQILKFAKRSELKESTLNEYYCRIE